MIFEQGLIAGIDPGTQKHNLGLAFVNTEGELVYCEEVPQVEQLLFQRRCYGMDGVTDGLFKLESRFANAFHDARMKVTQPILLAGIEEQWVGKSKQVALMLSKQFGAIVAILAGFGIYSIRIYPTQAKKALTGTGKAKKEDMLSVARAVYGYQKSNENVADAIGIALAALERWKEWSLEQLA